jgi:hypothetical protein
MSFKARLSSGFRAVRFFFPVVLIFSHLKYNLIACLYWVLFFAIVADTVGPKFGIRYLFLSPEYQGNVNFWSYALIGFAFGGFTMAFNSYSYLKLGPRFPFLATVHKPFVKFCINNCLIPLAFSVFYLWNTAMFLHYEEYTGKWQILWYFFAYFLGFSVFVGITLAYLFPVNKNFFDLLSRTRPADAERPRWSRISHGKHIKFAPDAASPLYWYIGKRFKVQQCRSTRHYSATLLQNVFTQNRISTTIFEITTVIAFILLGLLGNFKWLEVPAGMSIVMLLTIILMLFSALISWIKGWTYLLLIFAFAGMDYLSGTTRLFHFESQAYGLTYDHSERVSYNNEAVVRMAMDDLAAREDSLHCVSVLENWKKQTGQSKPLLIVVNVSGGGSRSAAWVFESLRQADSVTKGEFFRHNALICGASGGMIGAAFYRGLRHEIERGSRINIYDPRYYRDITGDLLNRLSFAASTNDIFFRYRSRNSGGNAYNFDRGMAFEADLNENTEHLIDHRLDYYKAAEDAGKLPVMIFSPTIVNDGRRLLVSSQKLSFMTWNNSGFKGLPISYENIDVHRLLPDQPVGALRFTSVLRMNATFPYVLPMVSLPTNPSIQVMDAGSRDNFGTKTAGEWLFAMRDWIRDNTSGVLIVQIRDTKKMLTGQEIKTASFLDKFTFPFTNLFRNFPRTQDFDQEELLKMMGDNPRFPMSYISLNLREFAGNRISLSFHLTTREKVKIREAIRTPGNREAFRQIVEALRDSRKMR